jgi:hypothetical protein
LHRESSVSTHGLPMPIGLDLPGRNLPVHITRILF